jgi:hypothetical protein
MQCVEALDRRRLAWIWMELAGLDQALIAVLGRFGGMGNGGDGGRLRRENAGRNLGGGGAVG